MHINKNLGTRAAAWAGAVLTAAMGLCTLAVAEPVTYLDGAQPPLGVVGATRRDSALEAPAPDASDSDGDANLVMGALAAHRDPGREARWRTESKPRNDRGQPKRAPVRTGSHVMAPSALPGPALDASELPQWHRELADTVLEVVLPAYEGLATSGILQAVRSLETELGLNYGHSFDDRPSGVHAHNPGDGTQPEAVGWSGPGAGLEPRGYFRSGAQIAEDQRMAAIKIKELIDDAKLWALALVGLYGLGFLVKLTLDYRRIKRGRRRSLSSRVLRRRRHRQHKRRPLV